MLLRQGWRGGARRRVEKEASRTLCSHLCPFLAPRPCVSVSPLIKSSWIGWV